MKHFAVTREKGPGWDPSQPLRKQKMWTEHAAFMNQLAEEGFVIFGGPVGDQAKLGFSKAIFLVYAESENIIETRLKADPWTKLGLLRTKIEPWEILQGKGKLAHA